MSFLIYDIETSQKDKSKPLSDLSNNKLRYFGAYSTKHKKVFIYTEKEKKQIKALIKEHEWFVGFNNSEFDDPILKQEGLAIPRYKSLDLLQIIKKRISVIKHNNELLGTILENFKLDTIADVLGLGRKVSAENDSKLKAHLKSLNIKYMHELMNRDKYTDIDREFIIKYLKIDVQITYKLWCWIYKYFDSFKHFISKEDADKLEHIKSSPAVYGYKVLCNFAGIEEVYNRELNTNKFEGAYVSTPKYENVKGKIYCYDFNSLYPSIMVMANIYAPNKHYLCSNCGKCWVGNKMFEIEGKYCKRTLCRVCKTIIKLYEQRLEFKKQEDAREYAIKIVLNILYGILGNSNFKSVYNIISAGDVTRLARQFIQYASKCFEKAGYEVLYNDTDSCYILDKVNNFERLEKVKNQIIKNIKKNMPFDFKHFDMGLDYEIQAMFFFKDNKGNFKKKNYAYITTKNKLILKGLKVIKSDCSKLSKYVYNRYLKQQIIDKQMIKFNKRDIYKMLKDGFTDDINLVSKRVVLKSLDVYDSKTSIQYMLSEKYGNGIYNIVSTKKYGVGKGKRYCTVEEFKKKKLGFKDLDIEMFYKELEPFIDDMETDVNVMGMEYYF